MAPGPTIFIFSVFYETVHVYTTNRGTAYITCAYLYTCEYSVIIAQCIAGDKTKTG